MRTARIAAAGATMLLVALWASLAGAAVPGTSCPVFPADNVWHSDISTLPVHARSTDWLASMNSSTAKLHPDFGDSGLPMPYGIPYTVVPGTHAKTTITFDYADESDAGPYPFGADTPIEGSSDRHAIMIDEDTCVLYELFDANYSADGSTAGSGAIWDLTSNDLRPADWTSADAAGLPVFAGLLRPDEIQSGNVDHAIRVTASRTDRSYVWPARHQAGYANDPALPPMGARFRLKSSYAISGFSTQTQTVLRAMKKHGLILADNGSNWYFQGAAESTWSDTLISELKQVPANQFEAVDASSLMISPDSGAARAASSRSTIPPGRVRLLPSASPYPVRSTGPRAASLAPAGAPGDVRAPIPRAGAPAREKATESEPPTRPAHAAGLTLVAAEATPGENGAAPWNALGAVIAAACAAGVAFAITRRPKRH